MTITYILDTTALLYFKRYQGRNVTTLGVLNEVKRREERIIVEALVEGGLIEVLRVPEEYIDRARSEAQKTGDIVKLSDTDIEVIALSKFLSDQGEDVTVITDDYSIQNVLENLGIKYRHIIRRISRRVKWKLKCEKCGKVYPLTFKSKVCVLCGGLLRRTSK